METGRDFPQTEDRTLHMVCHLLGLAMYTGIPLANILAPLLLWLWKRESNPGLNAHGIEVLNFQISMAIYAFAAGILMLVWIGIILLPIVLLAHLVLTIIGALEANKGRLYRYPATIRLLH